MTTSRTLVIISLAIIAILIAPCVLANAAPPGADVQVLYDGKEMRGEVKAEFLSCGAKDFRPERQVAEQLLVNQYDNAKNCYWNPFSMQRWGTCTAGKCNFFPVPYGETRMAVYLPSVDKTYVTNTVNANAGMNSYYVALYSNGSSEMVRTSRIIEQTNETEDWHKNITPESPLSNITVFAVVMLSSLAITLLIELITAWIYASIRKIQKKNRRKLLMSVVYADLISVPLFWLLVFAFTSSARLFESAFSFTMLLELIVIIFEAYFIRRLNKKTLTLKQAFVLSIIMNVASVVLPLVLLTAIGMMQR
jgi:hypothetical protein